MVKNREYPEYGGDMKLLVRLLRSFFCAHYWIRNLLPSALAIELNQDEYVCARCGKRKRVFKDSEEPISYIGA